MTALHTIDHARQLDAADPLRPFRDRFYLPANHGIYLDGNSLGLLSHDAEAAVRRTLEEWKTRGIGGWLDSGWFTLAERIAERLAPLLGAEPDEVAVANSTTVNLHQLLATLYRPEPGKRTRILAFAGDFPSDIFALRSHLRGRGLDPAEHLILLPASPDRLLAEEAAVRAMDDPTLAMAVLPAVVYTTGQLLDTARLAAAAQAAGVIFGFDLSHSVGVVPHRLSAEGADFAFWCHYKYLNAGPGAVGGLYLNRRHQGRAPGLAGWWGSRKERMFEPGVAARGDLEATAGAGGLQIGTPSVLSMAALDGALAISEEAGIERIRAKSLWLTDYLMRLVESELPHGGGIAIANPREAARRGGHVALVHPAAGRLCRALRDAGVVADHRPPDILRLAPAPLYVGFEDCLQAVDTLGEVLMGGIHERLTEERSLVP